MRKKPFQQDERILMQKRKVGNEAAQLLFYGLLAAILVQQYFLGAPFSQYAAEAILFLGVSLYIVVRNLMLGNDLFAYTKRGQKRIIGNSIICGLVVTGINLSIRYIKSGDLLESGGLNAVLVPAVTFLSAAVACFAVLEAVYLVNKKKQMKLDEKLDRDEE